MNQKYIKVLMIMSIIFFVYFILANQIMAFGGDSFSQQVGDEYTWEVKVEGYNTNPQIDEVGDRLKIRITITNSSGSLCCGTAGDAIYGHMYNNSIANRTWERFMTNFHLATYNISTGYFHEMAKFFFPHNETVLNLYWEDIFTHSWNFETFNWSSGPNGYDGIAQGYNGSSLGDLNEVKREYKMNSTGALEYYRVYNGTGSGWNMIYSLELIDSQFNSNPIPGFVLLPILFLFSCFIALYGIFFRKSRD